MNYKVRPYNEDDKPHWNTLVSSSRNGVFLYNRMYMEYHSDRFQDASLVIEKEGSIVAVLPANKVSDKIYSHQGLTFGGLVVGTKIKLAQTLDIFNELLKYLKESSFKEFYYKPVPRDFRSALSDDDLYALFLNDAELVRRDTNFVIPLYKSYKLQDRRKRMVKKAKSSGFTVNLESKDYKGYWDKVLSPVLLSNHGIKPVHTLDEIVFLADCFKDELQLCTVSAQDGEMVAGTLLYKYGKVLHSQYIAALDVGKKQGALDYLFSEIIKNNESIYDTFSFGIANEDAGKTLNKGLAEWKEGFSGRVLCHDVWKVNL